MGVPRHSGGPDALGRPNDQLELVERNRVHVLTGPVLGMVTTTEELESEVDGRRLPAVEDLE